ncbi:MAG: hypothetical protein LBE13_21600 [Bacteroidales bacterium]|jgi:hypothetical protein|nr:hypothetical protein [Bacteroidales bacterium]
MKVKVFLSSMFLWASIVILFAQEQGHKKNIDYSNISEVGFVTTSPRGIAFEATTVNGFSINKKHHIGLGVGFGGSFYETYYTGTAYTPVFINYRFYFKPENKFSPHVNISAGGLLVKDGEGLCSSFTAGFKAGKFSFSSGISFMAIYRGEKVTKEDCYYSYRYSYKTTVSQWHFPFGITVKCGFTL